MRLLHLLKTSPTHQGQKWKNKRQKGRRHGFYTQLCPDSLGLSVRFVWEEGSSPLTLRVTGDLLIHPAASLGLAPVPGRVGLKIK